MPVETSHLLLAEICGDLLVPCGPAHNGNAPEQAAQNILLGAPNGIPVLRRVAVDWVQMRRRQIFTYVVATKPLTYADAACLTYRDGRADLLVLPTVQATSSLPALARARVRAGLKALADEEMAYLETGVVSRTESVRLTGSQPRSVEFAVREDVCAIPTGASRREAACLDHSHMDAPGA
ncbi:hypothetical protein ACH4TQ_48160 [Streptomyces sp. NPDC021218]|uniref:hypothetical protein n=1 Tax=Streptomyces sp. NPDC021218 TaxID=3365119 RepID=UPI00379185FF